MEFKYLLINERLGIRQKPSGVEGFESAENITKISRPHVLASIYSESSHTHFNQHVQVFCHFFSYVVLLQSQIQQTHQAAISDLSAQVQT